MVRSIKFEAILPEEKNMPKKTKKEKLIAEARRIIKESSYASQSLNPNRSSVIYPPSKPINNILNTGKFSISNSDLDTIEYAAIRKDIIKTVLLAGIAIGIELAFFLKFR
jgi:hypothetical protein